MLFTFSFIFPNLGTVYAKTPARIHEIQGSFFISTKVKQEVETSGIVTSLYISTKGLEGFYVQSPKNEEDTDVRTSEAIYVKLKTPIATAKNTLKEGHKVTVSGVVAELPSVTYKGSSDIELTTTAIDNAQIDATVVGDFLNEVSVVALAKDRPIPTVISDQSITDALTPDKYSLDYFESLEAMRVSVENPQLTASPAQDTYSTIIQETNQSLNGGVVAEPARMFGNLVYLQVPFRFSNNANRNDKTRMKGETGDVLKGNLFGVVTYGYGTPKVYLDYNQFDLTTNTFMADKVTIQARGNKREVADFKSEANAPTIAQYNIENFSANPKTTSDAHVDGIANDIINHLFLPDIINLCEVQDNDGEDNTSISDASQSIKRLVDAIEKKSGLRYESLSINPEYNADGGAPNANIRVVHLYNPTRVKPLVPAVSTPNEILNPDGTLSNNPSRLGVESPAFKSTRKPLVSQFVVDGQKLTVIGNHLSSKRGDASLYGNTQPPFLGSEAGRDEQAKLINQFVQALQQKDPDANVVVLGDFNDYEYSKPMATLKGTQLVNMIDKLAPNTRYSYNYLGRQQTLDHILVSNNLGDSKVDAVHINADFRSDNGRNSDHDPIVVQLKFPKIITPTPTAPPAINSNAQSGTNNPSTVSSQQATSANKDGVKSVAPQQKATASSNQGLLPDTGGQISVIIVLVVSFVILISSGVIAWRRKLR